MAPWAARAPRGILTATPPRNPGRHRPGRRSLAKRTGPGTLRKAPVPRQGDYAIFLEGDPSPARDRACRRIVLTSGVLAPARDARGFSFTKPAPLDMRMTATLPDCATDRKHRRCAGLKRICASTARSCSRAHRAPSSREERRPIETTDELAGLSPLAMPARMSHGGSTPRQDLSALRIAVNDELQAWTGIASGIDCLKEGGVFRHLFHSLEDRM